jgi:uncharacterized membrane protein
MADLIAVAYPNKETATDVVRTLARLQTEHVIELADVVIVNKDQDGRVRLQQRHDLLALGLWEGPSGEV